MTVIACVFLVCLVWSWFIYCDTLWYRTTISLRQICGRFICFGHFDSVFSLHVYSLYANYKNTMDRTRNIPWPCRYIILYDTILYYTIFCLNKIFACLFACLCIFRMYCCVFGWDFLHWLAWPQFWYGSTCWLNRIVCYQSASFRSFVMQQAGECLSVTCYLLDNWLFSWPGQADSMILHQVLPIGTDLFDAPMPTEEEIANAPITPRIGTTFREVGTEPDKVVAHVHVFLPNGRGESVELWKRDNVASLSERACRQMDTKKANFWSDLLQFHMERNWLDVEKKRFSLPCDLSLFGGCILSIYWEDVIYCRYWQILEDIGSRRLIKRS